jgi:hypothetical protein
MQKDVGTAKVPVGTFRIKSPLSGRIEGESTSRSTLKTSGYDYGVFNPDSLKDLEIWGNRGEKA